MRAGIIGFGLSGRVIHLPLLRRAGFEVSTVAVTDPLKYTEHSDINFVTVEDLCADPTLDLIVVASPNALHEAHGMLALESGKHVVFEKPLASTLKSANRISSAAQKARGRASVFHSRRWDGDFLTLQDCQRRGAIGDWQIFESRWSMNKPVAQQRWKDQDALGGGLLVDFMPHLVDQTLTLFGLPQSASLDRATQRSGALGADCLAITMAYGDRRARLFVDCFGTLPGQRFRLAGTGGEYVCTGIDNQDAELRLAAEGKAAKFVGPSRTSTLATFHGQTMQVDLLEGDYAHFYRNFKIAIETGTDLPVSTQEAERVVEIIDTLNRNGVWMAR